MKRIVRCVVSIVFLVWAGSALADNAVAISTRMVQIESRPGVQIRIIRYSPTQPVGNVILFPDGSGLLDITHVFNIPDLGRSEMIPRELMDHVLAEDIAIVLVDAPSDHRSMLGLNGWDGPHIFRLSRDHARDIEAVVAYLEEQDGLPVWLAGIRMGAFSAATAAIHLQQRVAGLVIAGGMTQCPEQNILLQLCPAGLMGMPLHEITIPTLILSGGEAFPEPLLASALKHSPSIHFQTFPEFAAFETWGGWDASRSVLPGVSNAHVSREMAHFMHWHRMSNPVLICKGPPEGLAPLEVYLVGCYF